MPARLTDNLLTVMGQIGAHVFAGDGSLEKPGPDSPMGKYGPDDPFGAGNCDCPSIKNHPAFTGTVETVGNKRCPSL